MAVITCFVLVLTFISGVSWHRLGFVLLAGVSLSAQWFAFGGASLWLPGLPVLVAIGAAFTVTILISSKIPEPLTTVSLPQAEIEIPPRPIEPAHVDKMSPAKKTAKATDKSVAKASAKTSAKPPEKKAAPNNSVTGKSSRTHKKPPT